MKKYIKYKLYGLLLFLFAFASCETADADVSPIISPLNKPVVTVTPNFSHTPIEGETVTYSITLDKTIDRSITFTPMVTGGTAGEHDYEPLESVVLEGYTKSVDFPVVIINNHEPNSSKNLEIQLEILGIAEKYLVHPDTTIPVIDLNWDDYYNPTLLVVYFSWDTDDDMDMVTMSDTADYPLEPWGAGGATSANPEVDESIWLADPLGDYYVDLIDWDEGVTFNYTFTVVHPDASIQTFTGIWNPANSGDYFADTWLASWGSPAAYRLLKVVNDGTKFVVTAL